MDPTIVSIIRINMAILTAVLLTIVERRMFHIFQLSSYRIRGVWNWLKKSKFDYCIRYFALGFLSFISMYVFSACFGKYGYVLFLSYLPFVLFSVLFLLFSSRDKVKVPIKFTARMVRLNIVAFFVNLMFSMLVYLSIVLTEKLTYALGLSVYGLLPLLLPISSAIAGLLMAPFETFNNFGYKVNARKKLEMMPEMIRIGITGSYGKTTAKMILAKMLEKKFRICYSQKSYNTPMGICKVVNNDLSENTQIFIAEMGARFTGDIKELTEIVRPNYGIITAIGNQHLETFGSRENIISTKYELIENLYPGGLALFNGDSEPCVDLYKKTTREKMITGAEGTFGAKAYYKDVSQDMAGVNFTLHLDGKDFSVETKLLGRHIPSIMTLCAALAFELGVSAREIVDVCSTIEPVPHRLELIYKNDQMLIIDDAYNANIAGAENALIALGGFDGWKKVIITPGLVELGEEEKPFNIELGRKIGSVCDFAFLIGERGVFLKEGAMASGMAEENILLVESTDVAVSKLRSLPGRLAVLFENDLPDNY